ncbi:DMT family transporter [Desulfoferula mesophila]|uniref:EamA domain-containing protein n=1 Tax=Desulfoferula mesophila TaxID=3058419 RepID=A0AAU9EYY5_9BACT|nr:hypothetical protein FAK_38010 [Desulfoferula mesophilus]
MVPKSLPRGASMVGLAALGVAVMAAIVKWASAAFSIEFLLSVRMTAGMAMFLAARRLYFPELSLATAKPRLQVINGTVYVAAMYCLYSSLSSTPLPKALLLFNLAPILATAWNHFFRKIRQPWPAWLGTALGLAGVVLVMVPASERIGGVSWLALASGVLMSVVLVTSNMLGPTEPKERISFYVVLCGVVISLGAMSVVGVHYPAWQHSLFPPRDWASPFFEDTGLLAALLSLGLLTILVPALTSGAYHYASMGELGPFRYSGVLFAALIDWLVWSQFPAWNDVLAFALITAGGALAVWGRRAYTEGFET